MSADLLARFDALDRALASRGVPPTSPRWREALTAFYTHPTARELVACVGRGGIKSTTGAKMAIAETLSGGFVVPSAERHFFAIVSENLDEARKTLRQLRAYLDLIGERHTPAGDGLDLARVPLGIKVLAARVGAVSGFRCIGWTADEVAKWSDDSGANPAAEVIASLRAMTVTHPQARGRLFSTPVGQLGLFYDRLVQGDTPRQVVVQGPSWDFNPSITEAQTRELEPDDRIHAREYRAVPQGSLLSAFTAEDIDPAFEPLGGGYVERVGNALCAADSTQLRSSGDFWTFASAAYSKRLCDEQDRWLWHSAYDAKTGALAQRNGAPVLDYEGNQVRNPDFVEPQPVLYVSGLWAIGGHDAARTTVDGALERMARGARESGASVVVGDSYQAPFLVAGLGRRGIRYEPMIWSNESKAKAIGRLRTWFRERTIRIEPGPEGRALRQELLSFQERVLPSGLLSYGARRGGHDDRVALLINLAMADLDGLLLGSPLRPARERIEVSR